MRKIFLALLFVVAIAFLAACSLPPAPEFGLKYGDLILLKKTTDGREQILYVANEGSLQLDVYFRVSGGHVTQVSKWRFNELAKDDWVIYKPGNPQYEAMAAKFLQQ